MLRHGRSGAGSPDLPEAEVPCEDCEKPIGLVTHVDQTGLVAQYEVFKAASEVDNRGRKGGKARKTWNPQTIERKRGDDFNGYQPEGQRPSKDVPRASWLDVSDMRYPDTPLTHSAKTAKILEIIQGWQEDAEDEKIIVFTQWVTMGRIIGRHLEDAGIDFLYYFGELSPGQKAQNLKTFEDNKKIKVIGTYCFTTFIT